MQSSSNAKCALQRKLKNRLRKLKSKAHKLPQSRLPQQRMFLDLESSNSLLTHADLKAVLSHQTFASLPADKQLELIHLLPICDRITNSEGTVSRLASKALNNEFFTEACCDWRKRLANGEFTSESRLMMKLEQEKERARTDPWKLKHFESFWGEKRQSCRSPVETDQDASERAEDLLPLSVGHQLVLPVQVNSTSKHLLKTGTERLRTTQHLSSPAHSRAMTHSHLQSSQSYCGIRSSVSDIRCVASLPTPSALLGTFLGTDAIKQPVTPNRPPGVLTADVISTLFRLNSNSLTTAANSSIRGMVPDGQPHNMLALPQSPYRLPVTLAPSSWCPPATLGASLCATSGNPIRLPCPINPSNPSNSLSLSSTLQNHLSAPLSSATSPVVSQLIDQYLLSQTLSFLMRQQVSLPVSTVAQQSNNALLLPAGCQTSVSSSTTYQSSPASVHLNHVDSGFVTRPRNVLLSGDTRKRQPSDGTWALPAKRPFMETTFSLGRTPLLTQNLTTAHGTSSTHCSLSEALSSGVFRPSTIRLSSQSTTGALPVVDQVRSTSSSGIPLTIMLPSVSSSGSSPTLFSIPVQGLARGPSPFVLVPPDVRSLQPYIIMPSLSSSQIVYILNDALAVPSCSGASVHTMTNINQILASRTNSARSEAHSQPAAATTQTAPKLPLQSLPIGPSSASHVQLSFMSDLRFSAMSASLPSQGKANDNFVLRPVNGSTVPRLTVCIGQIPSVVTPIVTASSMSQPFMTSTAFHSSSSLSSDLSCSILSDHDILRSILNRPSTSVMSLPPLTSSARSVGNSLNHLYIVPMAQPPRQAASPLTARPSLDLNHLLSFHIPGTVGSTSKIGVCTTAGSNIMTSSMESTANTGLSLPVLTANKVEARTSTSSSNTCCKCGAPCPADGIGSSRLCITCLIMT